MLGDCGEVAKVEATVALGGLDGLVAKNFLGDVEKEADVSRSGRIGVTRSVALSNCCLWWTACRLLCSYVRVEGERKHDVSAHR